MNKAHVPSKPAQMVQFTKDIQSELSQQGGTQSLIRNQQNVPNKQTHHNRKTHQRLQGAISPYNTINGTYSIGKKLGEGSFGVIYQGTNINTKESVAIKFEPKKTDAPQLADEYRFYKIINPAVGFPICYYFGREGPYSVLCIELLGPSLEDLFDLCGRKFSVKTVCMAAKQMISRIWSIHEHKYIYRDIKPDNFLIGRVSKVPENHFEIYNSMPTPPNIDRKIVDYYMSLRGKILPKHTPEKPHPASLIYIVDFGMAKQYLDPYTQTHIPYREKKSLSGTARYMSINTHLGIEQSRRDDLEALGHVLMYFLRGSLPWQGLRGATNKQKYEKIGNKKQSTHIRSLCAGYPKEFETYLDYTRSLKFSETPNYKYLIKLFDKVLEKIGERDDGVFDWMIEMDNQAEKDQLRENAWKRRDERDYGHISKYWQNQYSSAISKKNKNSYGNPPLDITSPPSSSIPQQSFNTQLKPFNQMHATSSTTVIKQAKPLQIQSDLHSPSRQPMNMGPLSSKKVTLLTDSFNTNTSGLMHPSSSSDSMPKINKNYNINDSNIPISTEDKISNQKPIEISCMNNVLKEKVFRAFPEETTGEKLVSHKQMQHANPPPFAQHTNNKRLPHVDIPDRNLTNSAQKSKSTSINPSTTDLSNNHLNSVIISQIPSSTSRNQPQLGSDSNTNISSQNNNLGHMTSSRMQQQQLLQKSSSQELQKDHHTQQLPKPTHPSATTNVANSPSVDPEVQADNYRKYKRFTTRFSIFKKPAKNTNLSSKPEQSPTIQNNVSPEDPDMIVTSSPKPKNRLRHLWKKMLKKGGREEKK